MAAPEPESTGEHVDRVYARFREAIRQLFERQTRSPTWAEDFTQTVYEHLLKCRTLDRVEDPKSYIFQVAWNVLKKEMPRINRERKRDVSLSEEKSEAEVYSNPNLWVDNSSAEVDEEYLANALASLNPAHRRVFLMHEFGGLTIEQISELTGTNVHTVSKWHLKAWAHIRAHYGNAKESK